VGLRQVHTKGGGWRRQSVDPAHMFHMSISSIALWTPAHQLARLIWPTNGECFYSEI